MATKKRASTKKKTTVSARARAEYAKLKKGAAALEKKAKQELAAHKKCVPSAELGYKRALS